MYNVYPFPFRLLWMIIWLVFVVLGIMAACTITYKYFYENSVFLQMEEVDEAHTMKILSLEFTIDRSYISNIP